MDSDIQQLLNRLQETVEARIEGMAQSRYDIDETSVASLAAHFTAMRAVESYIDDTMLIRESVIYERGPIITFDEKGWPIDPH